MANIQRKPPKLTKNARKELTDDHFRKLVYYRCSKYPDEIVPTPKAEHIDEKLERLIGSNDLLPISFLEEGTKKAPSIGKITAGRYVGTGFLIGPDIIMTNNHVIKSKQDAQNAIIEFNYELGVDTQPKNSESFTLKPDSIFITNSRLDFTIVRVEGKPGEKFGWIPILRNPFTITRHERVYIIQHPKGRRKEIGIHDNRATEILQHVIRYSTDTEGGSSGSPCFNRDWDIVGIHHSAGKRGPNGTFVDNEAIKISSIFRYLQSLVDSERNEAYDVLKFAKGEDPYSGLFGQWGLKLHGTSKWESVVTDYRGTADYLDVGFWNIEHFNNSTSDHRKIRVADVISRLNLDILGLVEVSKESIKFVTKELRKLDKNFGYLIKDVRGRQDLAIIYNKDTLKVKLEEWDDEAVGAFDSKIRGKTLFYRHPMKVRVSSKVSSDDNQFDFKLIVLHAKATTHKNQPDIPPIVRKASAKALSEAIEREIKASENEGKMERDYVIGGDFNAKLEEGSFDVLANRLNMIALTEEDALGNDPNAYTYLMRGNRSIIDHVYITKSANLHYDPGSISITRIDKEMPRFTQGLSDHAPVAMRLTWSKRPTKIKTRKETKVHSVSIPADVETININLEK
ncbi:MAG: trypsin-like peptidase domain-containing protein [Nitrosopumilus sp.]|nr:trypsin-like peptidase domain-containing protein [Nitrosopumilus sp.]